jgi:hypothetical protein
MGDGIDGAERRNRLRRESAAKRSDGSHRGAAEPPPSCRLDASAAGGDRGPARPGEGAHAGERAAQARALRAYGARRGIGRTGAASSATSTCVTRAAGDDDDDDDLVA